MTAGAHTVPHPRGPIMRRAWVVVVALAASGLGSSPAGAEVPKGLEPLGFLLGDWQAEGGGKPGEASGGFTFASGLQGRVIVRTNHAEYPATADKPSSRQEDLMVLYPTESGEIRADYYDSEGHVIHYVGSTPSGSELTLVSEVSSGAPRFRLGYKLRADGVLDGRFEIAPPGKPESFGPYLAWTSRRRLLTTRQGPGSDRQ
jgi:hypothetical protein